MWHAFPDPQGVAIVGIYPCGKARKPDKSEGRECSLSLSPNDPGSVLAVKGAASGSAEAFRSAGAEALWSGGPLEDLGPDGIPASGGHLNADIGLRAAGREPLPICSMISPLTFFA